MDRPGDGPIEHTRRREVIKTADWIIDMGPDGGSRGGMVVAEGSPEEIAQVAESHTGAFLKPLLDGREAKQTKAKRAPKVEETKPTRSRTKAKAKAKD